MFLIPPRTQPDETIEVPLPAPRSALAGQTFLPLTIRERHPDHEPVFLHQAAIALVEPRRTRIAVSRAPTPQDPTPGLTFLEPEISPVMGQVEAIITRLARACHPMPTNPQLGEMCGGRGRNVVAHALNKLIKAGRVRVHVGERQRRVYVVGQGTATAWGTFQAHSHKPYSANPRGTVAPRPVVRPTLDRTEDRAPRYRIEPARLVVTTPADACQWPLWDDLTPWGERRCCGRDTRRPGETRAKRSWCAEHAGLASD